MTSPNRSRRGAILRDAASEQVLRVKGRSLKGVALTEPYTGLSPNRQRVLEARHVFQARVDDLRHVGSVGGSQIVQAVVDVITALNAVVSDSWVPPFTDEFNAWNHVDPDDTGLDSLHTAARAVVDAGDRLVGAWHTEHENERFADDDLSPAQHEFVNACGRARDLLVTTPSAP